MKKIVFVSLAILIFSNCNRTKIDKCCSGAPQIVYIDSSYIAMPDLFTPNGDGINDQLLVISKNIVSSKFTITKRFGKVVFSSIDITTGWNGGNEKEKTYSYTVEATTTSGNTLSLSGDVAIIRDNCANGNFEECFFATQFNSFSNTFDRNIPSNEIIKACN